MTKKRPRDPNQLAKAIVGIATGEISETSDSINEPSRKGGLKGGQARARSLTKEERAAIARKGAQARWGKGRPAQVKKELT